MKENIIIREKILKWFKQYGRDFPWRHTDDPYQIMIAEFMLHRTKAEQVVPVYMDFLEEYPDIISLASASEKEMKKFTACLGLHWRHKNFIKAARYISDNRNGIFTDSIERLSKIPGVGEYISCAIRIIAYNKPAPVVDSNIARFFNRFYNLNLSGEIRRKKIIYEKSKEFFNTKKCKELLFAIIDFCSLICKPVKPLCDECIINYKCGFYKNLQVVNEL